MLLSSVTGLWRFHIPVTSHDFGSQHADRNPHLSYLDAAGGARLAIESAWEKPVYPFARQSECVETAGAVNIEFTADDFRELERAS